MDKYFTLQTLLNSIAESHDLLGWQIFQEKSGSTMFKIRFKNQVGDNTVDSKDSVHEYSSIKFRKVSQKEQQRDAERAKNHRLRNKPDRYSDPRNNSDKELPRYETPAQSPSHLKDSPESVVHDLNLSSGNASDIPFSGDASDLVKSPLYYRDTFEADSVSGSVCGSSVISEHTCVSSASLLSPLSPNPTCDDGPDGNCSPHVMLPDGASALSALTLQLKGAWKSDFACTKNSKDVSDSDEKSGDKQNSDCDDVNRQDHKYSSEID